MITARSDVFDAFLSEAIVQAVYVLAVILGFVLVAYWIACFRSGQQIRARGVIWGVCLYAVAAVLMVIAEVRGVYLSPRWLSLFFGLASIACAFAASMVISCSLNHAVNASRTARAGETVKKEM